MMITLSYQALTVVMSFNAGTEMQTYQENHARCGSKVTVQELPVIRRRCQTEPVYCWRRVIVCCCPETAAMSRLFLLLTCNNGGERFHSKHLTVVFGLDMLNVCSVVCANTPAFKLHGVQTCKRWRGNTILCYVIQGLIVSHHSDCAKQELKDSVNHHKVQLPVC